MSLTPTAERLGTYAVRYTWSGTAPYAVWVNGEKLLNQTTLTEAIVQFPGESVPHACEVRDANDSGSAESVVYSPRLRIQWRGQNDAEYYKVQTYTGGAWATQQVVREDGSGYYQFSTVAQTDGATVQWRVVPVDERGYSGAAIDFSQFVVRNPAPPDVTMTYAAGTGLLTVAAS